MIPAKLKEATTVYGKPATWTDDQCSSLEVWEGNLPLDDQGNTAPALVSCWELSPEELQVLQQTGKVYLTIFAPRQMPVSLSTINPIPKP